MWAQTFPFCGSAAFRCVLKQCQGGMTSSVILKNQLWLPIKLERLKRLFPNNLKSIIRQWERLSQVDDLGSFGVVLQPQEFTLCSHGFNHKLLRILKYSSVKREAICPRASLVQIWSSNTTMIAGTPANLQQRALKRQESKCCNGPVKVRHQADWAAWEILRERP